MQRGPSMTKAGFTPAFVIRSGPLEKRLGVFRVNDHEWNFTTSGTISSATMLMILISGFTAGPAVSL